MVISIQTDDFDLAHEYALLCQDTPNVGAVVTFTGKVRGKDQTEPLSHLFLEHFPGLTESEIGRIVTQAEDRWALQACRVIHRVGNLYVDEQIVAILVAATHRKEAFAAAEYIMDYLKTEAPFWKQEHFKNGDSAWVAAKASDDDAKNRW
ncbi:MAG: molybdenum cofactor biosynthesis protein MoaE [Neisseriaceae bacterium]|nr:molybdenum cofactor biosynthesis protein MoaE [Neisseriaceae bacterium]